LRIGASERPKPSDAPVNSFGAQGCAIVRLPAVTEPQLLNPDQLVQRSTHDLDWALLLDRLAGFTTSEPGGRRFRAKELATDWATAHASMLRTQEAVSLADEGLAIPSGDLPDLGDLIERLERAVVATGAELRDLGRMLATGKQLRAFAQTQKVQRPHLAEVLFSDPALDKLLERLTRSIETDGTLSDQASTTLSRARAKVRDCRQELVAQLKRLMHVHADLLRDTYFSERDGRYVIPVRADAHRGIDGTVLDTSASGNTLFIEPRELTAQSNRLRVAQAEVAHEEQRILLEISQQAKEAVPGLRVAENACIEADVFAALSRYAAKYGAVALLPTQNQAMSLRAARHPLLIGQVSEVVPNDLELQAGQALIISGPNAGGKTVSLKAFGLFAMMARAGIPLTVDAESHIGFFSEIYCEIGDSQSIVSSLSTFSAHVRVLASIIAHAGPSSLVLLDEIAGGTDPEQGAALASAYLEALVGRNATVASTTHYETLKELGNHDPRFRNAAVGFDVKSMLPSFRILLDIAGPSTAFAVAMRYGIPNAIVERATALIPKSSRDREQLLEQLTAERALAQTLRLKAEHDSDEQRRLRLELEQERAAVKTTFQHKLEQDYRELLGKVRVARTDLDNLRKRVQSNVQDSHGLSRAELAQLERAVDTAAHVVALGSPVAEAVRASKPSSSGKTTQRLLKPITVGSKVHLPRLGMDAEVLDISHKGTLKVRAGSITLTVAPEELEQPRQPHGQSKGTPPSRSAKNQPRKSNAFEMVEARSTPMRLSHNTLDLRGERVDAALERVDAFVDELLRRSEPAGYVLHGHGTGALKQAVRDHVRGLRHVLESGPATPEDGGDAFTLLWLGG
jgi:DNA mismatch repair protein MutS2